MFVRMSLLSVFAVRICLYAQALAGADGEKRSPSEKQRQKEIRKLIAQLNAEQFKDREEATRRLMEREDALPTLRAAVKSKDAEVRGRAHKALETLTQRLAKRALQRALAKLKKGKTDQFVDAVVSWRAYVDEDCWKAAIEHVEAIANKARKLSGGQFKLAETVPEGLSNLPWLDVTKLRFRHEEYYRAPENLFISCEPTAHRFVSRVFFPPPHHSPECLREPTAAVWLDVG
jgi:hypothetical protein